MATYQKVCVFQNRQHCSSRNRQACFKTIKIKSYVCPLQGSLRPREALHHEAQNQQESLIRASNLLEGGFRKHRVKHQHFQEDLENLASSVQNWYWWALHHQGQGTARGLSCHVQEWNLDDADFEGLIYSYLSIKDINKVSCLKAVSKNVVIQLLVSLAAREINLCCSERVSINSHSFLQQSTGPLRKARILQEALTQLYLKSVSHEGCLTQVSQKNYTGNGLRALKTMLQNRKIPQIYHFGRGKENCQRFNSRKNMPRKACLAAAVKTH